MSHEGDCMLHLGDSRCTHTHAHTHTHKHKPFHGDFIWLTMCAHAMYMSVGVCLSVRVSLYRMVHDGDNDMDEAWLAVSCFMYCTMQYI